MQYCSVADVSQVLEIFRDDIISGVQSIPDGAISTIIDEETLFIRNILQNRYTISNIESLASIPAAIRHLAKIKTAMTVLDRYGVTSPERNQAAQEFLRDNYNLWYRQITTGNLYDNDGNLIVTTPERYSATYTGNVNYLGAIECLNKYRNSYRNIYGRSIMNCDGDNI